MPKNIVYIHSDGANRHNNPHQIKLATELDVNLVQVETIQELLYNLSNPFFKVDVILVDLSQLYEFQGTSALDLLNTLNTLTKCTLYRNGDKTVKRHVNIAALVCEKSDITAIKDFMTLPGNCGFMMYGMEPPVSYDDVKLALTDILEGQMHVPKSIRDRLKTQPRPRKEGNTITLTPRETQILTIIRERGVSNKVIAKMLHISESTVKLHIGKVLKKYGVKNRTQLAVFTKTV